MTPSAIGQAAARNEVRATYHSARAIMEKICETLYDENPAKLSEYEEQERAALIKLCCHVATDFGK